MSSFKKDNYWNIIWDALYYNFIDKHQNILKTNYATALQVKNWDKKSHKQKETIKKIAKEYITNLLN
jgi:deoxyribodipyrimidine photolyase-like uncharacterized protein